ncbi:HTH-type transcriptional regulator BhcR [Puniceibacterium sediminis]|uniref:Transcriptional regulator, IclR family n=1 Tax=Puniceibacterium sediminis TaxID=1608407 RepID=A0A238XBJ5_9RHOB|nr:HTH-type transcriptional regulator BhcR [Puniceibacterium sediminis]SNR56406.1 transcriptional regulator, IclR family [Puniceibacterium sediminis]
MTGDSEEDFTARGRGRPRSWHDKSEQNTIKSLDRAMEVLERLSEMKGATLSQISGDLGQSPASVYRVLFTLEARGIVDFDSGPQTWHIGAGAFLIGSRFLRRTSLLERALPVLRSLMDATGETANLGIEQSGQVLFLSQVETMATIRAFFPPGTMSPMHASGIGKALLAQRGAGQVARILDAHGLERFTEFTHVTRDALLADLAETRARGYSIDGEEKNIGMRCVAAPIFDVHGVAVAGISVSGPSSRVVPDAIPGLGAQVIAAAAEITHGIGGRVSG